MLYEFYLYEISRIGKSMKTKGGMGLPLEGRDKGRKRGQ
jgi:hypothetical protein